MNASLFSNAAAPPQSLAYFDRAAGESTRAYRQRMLMDLAQMDKSDFPIALETILRVSADTLCVARTEFWRLSEDASSLTCEMLYSTDHRGIDASEHDTTIYRREFPEYFRALLDNRSVIADNVLEHPALQSLFPMYLKKHNIGALLDTAVWAGGKFIGALCVEHVGTERVWSGEETMFASFAAAMISLALEHSDRAHREAQHRTLIENATDGIYRTGVDGKFTFANAAIDTMLGYTPEELLGKPYYRFVHPDYRLRAVRLYHQQLQERIKSTYFEFPTIRKDGSEAWLAQNVQLVMEHGEVAGFQAVVRNITQRKLAENETLKALEKERQLGELKSRFVSMVLHELRTPLTGISLNTEILQRYSDKIDEGQKSKSYKKIFESIKRIVTLMDGVLLLSETETKKLTFRPRPVHLETLCREIIKELTGDEQLQSYIRFEIHDCEPTVTCDETLLRHILGHLLVNALKYSLTVIDVRFTVQCTETAVVFTIADKGIGIPADDIPFIFETFHRAKNATEKIPGTGVGLSIVKQCVTLHQGTIEVSSVLDEYTIFTVTIPREYPQFPNS